MPSFDERRTNGLDGLGGSLLRLPHGLRGRFEGDADCPQLIYSRRESRSRLPQLIGGSANGSRSLCQALRGSVMGRRSLLNLLDDEDFPSGRCQGTGEINKKCAFLDKNGRCSIQVAATEEGMNRWALKPLYCILFPIEVSDHIIAFDEMLQDDQSCCTIQEEFDVPLFRACKEELVRLVGEGGYMRMEEHYEKLQKTEKQPS